MAQVVNRLVDLGAKVIVSNLPDMGLSPYAATEAKANTDIDRAAMISRITAAFPASANTTTRAVRSARVQNAPGSRYATRS